MEGWEWVCVLRPPCTGTVTGSGTGTDTGTGTAIVLVNEMADVVIDL